MAASNKYKVPKHTQNSYGMCYLHTTNIFLPTLFYYSYFICLSYFVFKKKRNKSKTWAHTTKKKNYRSTGHFL